MRTSVQARASNDDGIVPFLEMRSFDFSNLPGGTGANYIDVPLCPAVYVGSSYRVRLAVRVHDLTISSGQSIWFFLSGAMPSLEDPAKDFIGSSFLSLSITDSVIAPGLVSASASDPDTHLQILLRGVQGSSMVALRATLSACLILRHSF